MTTALLVGNALRQSSCGELGFIGSPSGSGILQAPETPPCTSANVYCHSQCVKCANGPDRYLGREKKS